MFDLKASEERKINKLKGWRERYSKKEYPYKVIMNLFYELFSIESIWNEINSAFSGKKQFENLSEGYSHIGGIKREYQLAQIHPNLESFIKNNKVAAGIKYSDFEEKIHKAQNGDNNEVIEIEFSY
ncbi:hypothetical protein OAP50_01260, partial [bacterium]|nr:hypothetical protein [bacterium]